MPRHHAIILALIGLAMQRPVALAVAAAALATSFAVGCTLLARGVI